MKEINFTEKERMEKYPVLKKNGANALGGESTPFVWRNKLMLLENFWEGFGGLPGPCAVVLDYFTREPHAPFGGDGARFYSAYCENDRVYVFGTQDNKIYRYESDDLDHWTRTLVLTLPDTFELFNTSVCKGNGEYMMAMECAWKDHSRGEGTNKVNNPYIGVPFTEFFARSADLTHWETLPFERSYTPARYCACPALRYCEGYYYMICLEELPCLRFAPYMYRTKDFEIWEIGLYNPILLASEEDRKIKPGMEFPPETVALNETCVNINNSDVDLCEFEGRTYIVYLTGNQGITGRFNGMGCEAVYDGPLDDYLKANFI